MRRETAVFAAIAAALLVPTFIPAAMAEPSDIASRINGLIDRIFATIEDITSHFAQRALDAGIFIARSVYLTLIILGVVLRYTGISSFGGKNMIVGGLVLALLSEIVAMGL